MGRLTGKVAMITGASKGMGADIAKAFAREDAAVVVNYATSREGADKVVAEINGHGGKAIPAQGNVANEGDIKRIFAETLSSFGGLNILVNNAGVCEFSPLENLTTELYTRLFNTNVLGTLLATREAVKLFGNNGGTIINIGSAYTQLNIPSSSVYTASKAAIDSITAVLSKELGPKKIRINSINPGMVETDGARAAGVIGSDFQREFEDQTPLGRIGQVSDITPLAIFLASSDSGWLTGETLLASGGQR